MKRIILVLENSNNETIQVSYVSPKENGWYNFESSSIDGLVARTSKISWFNGSYWYWRHDRIPSSKREKVDSGFVLVQTIYKSPVDIKRINWRLKEIIKEKI